MNFDHCEFKAVDSICSVYVQWENGEKSAVTNTCLMGYQSVAAVWDWINSVSLQGKVSPQKYKVAWVIYPDDMFQKGEVLKTS